MSIRRKQNSDNGAWLDAMANIESVVSREEIAEISAKAIEEIRATTADKKAAYAWSGGKDSIVLSKLCEDAGVTSSLIGVCDLEYPEFMRWIESNKPAGCEVINTKQDLDWLAKHPEMLFPGDSAHAARWFSIVQHRAQRIYFQKHELDVLILARRRADGNYVGRGFVSCKKKNVSFVVDGNFPTALLVCELVPGALDGRKWMYVPSTAADCCKDADAVAEFEASFPPKEKKWMPSQEEFYIYSRSSVGR